jgi:hypothetical protein
MNKGKQRRLLGIPTRKWEWILLILFFMPVSAGIIYGILRYGQLDSPIFWIAAAIEVGFAFLTLALRPLPVLVLLTIAVALLSPTFVPIGIPSLIPVRPVWLVYALAGIWIALYREFRPAKPKPVKPLPYGFILPAYVPTGFMKTERKGYKRRGYEVIELIYENNKLGYVIWVVEAKGPIPHDKPRKNLQLIDKVIRQVSVHIEQEIPKPLREPPFIEANWSQKDMSFNLRSDGLSLDEAEKVIASLIP